MISNTHLQAAATYALECTRALTPLSGLIDGRKHLLVAQNVVHRHTESFITAKVQQIFCLPAKRLSFLLDGNTDAVQTHRLVGICLYFVAPENTQGDVYVQNHRGPQPIRDPNPRKRLL